MNFLERATTANAEFQGLADVRDQIQRATTIQAQIQALLQRASQYRSDGALMNPPGENAAEIYHRVLATDPENAIAQQSLSQVVAEILSRATTLLSAGDLEAVRALGARASEIGLSAAAIEQMQRQLQTEEQRVAGTARLLAEARALLDDGFITEPGEGNAVARLLEVLALDPGNLDAGELLNKAAGRLADVASEAYDAGLVDEAKHYLELALAVTPDVEAWRQLRARWELESTIQESGA
jgi:tetratricopeptide (TPR) repeat protein